MWPLIGTLLLLTLLSLVLGAFCAWLQKLFDGISVSEWLLDHFYCPAGRVLLLILTCLLLWPRIDPALEYGRMFRLLGDGDFLVSSLNILFLASLVLSFIPLLGHPAIGLPILSALATAVVAAHIAPDLPHHPRWWPDLTTLLQMLVIALGGHLAIRHLASRWARAYDDHFLVTGSIVLFNDWLYLLLQVPLIIVYGEWIQRWTGTISSQ
jgi:hypothetical protein